MESPESTIEDPFINSETSQIFIELMNSKKGREVAKNLHQKFMALSQSFKELNESEKILASIRLNQKFRDSLLLLKQKFIVADNREGNIDGNFFGTSVNIPEYHYYDTNNDLCNFVPLLVLVILLIAFFGMKLYKSLKEKEEKRLQKQKLKQEKKKK